MRPVRWTSGGRGRGRSGPKGRGIEQLVFDPTARIASLRDSDDDLGGRPDLEDRPGGGIHVLILQGRGVIHDLEGELEVLEACFSVRHQDRGALDDDVDAEPGAASADPADVGPGASGVELDDLLLVTVELTSIGTLDRQDHLVFGLAGPRLPRDRHLVVLSLDAAPQVGACEECRERHGQRSRCAPHCGTSFRPFKGV